MTSGIDSTDSGTGFYINLDFTTSLSACRIGGFVTTTIEIFNNHGLAIGSLLYVDGNGASDTSTLVIATMHILIDTTDNGHGHTSAYLGIQGTTIHIFDITAASTAGTLDDQIQISIDICILAGTVQSGNL